MWWHLSQCKVCLNDVLMYLIEWAWRWFFSTWCISDWPLTFQSVNLEKPVWLTWGEQVGRGQVQPVKAKVAAVLSCSAPNTRCEWRHGWVLYMLLLLLGCGTAVLCVWNDECRRSFEAAESLLCWQPPHFSLPYQPEVDAGALGAGIRSCCRAVMGNQWWIWRERECGQ